MDLFQVGKRRPTLIKIRGMTLGAIAVMGLILAGTALQSPISSLEAKAQADTTKPTSIDFYSELAAYGNWVSYNDQYVWIPNFISDEWRPYMEGHWAFTGRYGLIWVSEEKFGWATYHYGRWGHDSNMGWYWVPGIHWAPAWVAWSFDGDNIAWAPLPPGHYEGANSNTSFGFIPNYHWQAVPVSAFLSSKLSDYAFGDVEHVRSIIKGSKIRSVRIVSNLVLNNAIEVSDVERKTISKVVIFEAKDVSSAEAAAKMDGKFIPVFAPVVSEDPNLKPLKIMSVAEVTRHHKSDVALGTKAVTNGTVQDPSKSAAEDLADGLEKEASATATIDKKKVNPGATVATSIGVKPDISQATETKLAETTEGEQEPNASLPPPKPIKLATVDYDQTGNIVFGGTGPNGSKIQLYIDDEAHGLAFIGEKGDWSFSSPSSLKVGPHTLRANEIGSDGQRNSQLEMLFYREQPAKIADTPLPKEKPEVAKSKAVPKVDAVPALILGGAAEIKKNAPPPQQRVATRSIETPADELIILPIKKNKTIEGTKKTAVKTKQKCELAAEACLAIEMLFNVKPGNKKQAKAKANVRDVGAENWRVECSVRFGGWSKASETYVSSSGKRVSCAWRPKGARG